MLPLGKTPAVPKISVYEYNYSLTGKYNIRLARQVPDMLAETQTLFVQRTPYETFQGCVLSFDAGHAVAALRFGQIIRHYASSNRLVRWDSRLKPSRQSFSVNNPESRRSTISSWDTGFRPPATIPIDRNFWPSSMLASVSSGNVLPSGLVYDCVTDIGLPLPNTSPIIPLSVGLELPDFLLTSVMKRLAASWNAR